MKAPSDDHFAQSLRTIRVSRSRLMVCFLTFPVYVYVVNRMVGGGQDVTWMMLAYMALYAGFGINMSIRKCPRCHEAFYVKQYFLNPFRRRCAHCGLSYHSSSSELS